MGNTLTNVYNSTLGIPQQLLMRLFRKLKRGDANIFDEDGLLDMSLVPILGIWDEHTNDVQGSDLIDNPVGAFALDVFSDPTTYMTAGLSASGKLAKAMSKLGNQKGMEAVKKVLHDPNSKKTVGEFLASAETAVNIGKPDHKVLKEMNSHVRELLGNEGKLVSEVMKKSGDEVLMWGLPGLTKFGASWQTKSIEKQSSWFKWLGERYLEPGKRAAKLVSFLPVKHLPPFQLIGKALEGVDNAARSFGKGISAPLTPGLEIGYNTVNKGSATTHLKNLSDDRFELRKRLEKMGDDGASSTDIYEAVYRDGVKIRSLQPDEAHKRAFLASIGKRVDSMDTATLETHYRREVMALTGTDDIIMGKKALGDALGKFDTDNSAAVEFFRRAERKIVPSKEGEDVINALENANNAFSRTLFNVGRTIKKGWVYAWKRDVPIAGIEEETRIANSLRDQGTEQAQEVLRATLQAVREVSKEHKIPVAKLNQLLGNVAEASFGREEAKNIFEGLAESGDVLSAVKNINSYLGRSRAAMLAIGRSFKEMGLETPEELLDLANMKLDDFNALSMERLSEDINKPAATILDIFGDNPDKLNLTRQEFYDAKGNVTYGQHLGFLDDMSIDTHIADIGQKHSRNLTDSEIVLELDPAIANFAEGLEMDELSHPAFVKLLRDIHGGKERKSFDYYRFVEEGATKPGNATLGVTGTSSRTVSGKKQRLPIDKDMRTNLRVLADRLMKREPDTRHIDMDLMGQGQVNHYNKLRQLQKRRRKDAADPDALRRYHLKDALDNANPYKIEVGPKFKKVGPGKEFFLHGSNVHKGNLSIVAKSFLRLIDAKTEAERWALARAGLTEGASIADAENVLEIYKDMFGADSLTGDFFDLAQGLSGAADEFDEALLSVMQQGFGGKKTLGGRLIGSMLEMRNSITKLAIENGVIDSSTFSAGYLPRLLSPRLTEALAVLGSKFDSTTIQKFIPQLPANFPRKIQDLTLEELNGLVKDMRKTQQPEFAKTLERLEPLLKEANKEIKLFEDDPLLAMANGLGSAMTEKNTGGFIDSLIAAQSSKGNRHMFGGKVVGYVTDAGKKFHVKAGAKIGGKLSEKIKIAGGKEGDLGVQQINYYEDAQTLDLLDPHLLIEDDAGEIHVIAGNALSGSGFSMRVLSDKGKTLGQKYALSAVDDTMRNVKMTVINDTRKPRVLQELEGKNVLIGNNSVLGAIDSTVAKQFQQGNQVVRVIDGINYYLRKFQTVFRPAFHVSNLASGASQSAMLGTSVRHNISGHLTALKFLFKGDASSVNAMDKTAALLGGIRYQPKGRVQFGDRVVEIMRTVRRMGPEGLRGKEELKRFLGKEEYNAWSDEIIEFADGQQLSVSEILTESARGGLFGTFFAKGLGGAGTTPKALTDLAKETIGKVDDLGIAQGKLGFSAQMEGKLEVSEVLSRFGTLFGRILEHGDIKLAVKETQRAMVDYSQLTNFERAWMKRMFLYYTFPRRYVPFAWERFSKSPRGINALADGVANSGVLTTANGQVELNFESLGADVSVSAQRLNANIDAAMAIPAFIERLVPMDHISRPLATPGVIAAGGVGSVLFGTQEAFSPGSKSGKRHWMNDAIYSTWATKFAMGAFDDVTAAVYGRPSSRKFLDWGSEIAKFVMPAKGIEPGYERRIMIGNVQALMRGIERELEDTTVEWRRDALLNEAAELRERMEGMLD